jgi:hypothetical protein
VFAQTQTATPSSIYHSLEAGKPARGAGMLRGKILSVDYAAGEITVQNGRATQQVAVLPSTTLYHGHQYATLADLHPGDHVEIELSEIEGRLAAQTIRF